MGESASTVGPTIWTSANFIIRGEKLARSTGGSAVSEINLSSSIGDGDNKDNERHTLDSKPVTLTSVWLW
jgi:hypothetical protein